MQRRRIEGVYGGPFWRSFCSYFRIPFCRCTLKEVAHPRRAKTRTKSHFAVMRYVTLVVRPFCVADLIPREHLPVVVVQIVLMSGVVYKNETRPDQTRRASAPSPKNLACRCSCKKKSIERNSALIIFFIVSYIRIRKVSRKKGERKSIEIRLRNATAASSILKRRALAFRSYPTR